jgi:hypothetical protein
VQTSGDDVAATVENAAAINALLQREGLRHRTVELTLDEIFAAYVSGNRRGDSSSPTPAPELVPQS